MTRYISLLLILAFAVNAQNSAQPGAVRSWFPDGTGLEIYTESTAPAGANSVHAISRQGIIGIWLDKVYRTVVDKDNDTLFGYNLEARRSPVSDGIFIRIEPLAPPPPRFSPAATPSPTVATAREFPSVRIGQAVTLEILYNPSTGEKIYEVIRPITDPSPAPTHSVVTAAPRREQLSLKGIALRVNGQTIDAPVSWMLGAAARIDVPGHGMFIVSAYDPKNPLFYAAVRAERNSLSWLVDGERVELSSQTNVLAGAEGGAIWVYHDPHYKSSDLPNSVGLQTADSVEWLLPKK